ncbi:hypothetical protein V495_02683 [Pseudogymnoascus sp. VKM F-4514 (FW-929)]|nr:hypothetical protein V495_02683 [Pseudogymnoascus sp. VKM F-4514 (FW-929)]KFY53931.1 hypothetical protein V497_08154 [Pseudogymnoascus sp. VKM F-4516 (FW-969)]
MATATVLGIASAQDAIALLIDVDDCQRNAGRVVLRGECAPLEYMKSIQILGEEIICDIYETIPIMTRSNKFNDRDHAGLADGTASAEEHLPRYFAKQGHIDADPKKTKKNGGGRGNWGIDGEEIQDEGFTLTNARRRSNSSSYAAGLKDFKTKFEQFDPDPVFEEDIHGARPEDDMEAASRVTTESSESGGSVDDGEGKKEV